MYINHYNCGSALTADDHDFNCQQFHPLITKKENIYKLT